MALTEAPTRARDRAGLPGVARGGLANLAGAAVAGAAGFGVTWLAARGLGPARAGAFFAATAAFVLLGTVAKLGTQTSLVYFPARLRAAGASVQALRRCLRVGLPPVGVAGVLAGLLLWLGAPALASLTAHGGGGGYVSQLRTVAVFLPVAVLSDTLLAATRGWRVMRPTVVLDRLIRPLLQLVGLGLLAVLTVRAAPPYALAWAAPYLPTALLAALCLYRLLQTRPSATRPAQTRPAVRRPSPRPRPRTAPAGPAPGSDAGSFWRFTAPRALASVAQLALQRVDVLLLAGLAGLRAAAVYAVAGRFVVLGQFANQAISQAVQPRLAELLGRGDRRAAGELYRTATGWLVLAAWPLYLGVAVFAPAYLELFGPGYHHATTVVVVLAAAMLVGTGCGMVDMMLSMAGRTSWNLANVSAALAVNLAVDLVLVPRLGASGAAVGLAAAVLTNNLVPLAQIGIVLRLHPFGRGTLYAAALALACFGALPAAVRAVAGAHLASAGCAAVLGATAYLAAVTRLRRVLRLDAFTTLRRAAT